jgi:vancomycin resistance protein VanJ
VDAAREVERYDPDIVLLQESPSEDAVRALAEDLYGSDASVVWGLDASVVTRGQSEVVAHEIGPHVAVARMEMPSGLPVYAISLRLSPPILRFDLWSPAHWREQAAKRRRHREEMKQVVRLLDGLPDQAPVVLGGDFNAPAGDAVTRPLRPRLRDSFMQGGLGWGNTVLNDIPILRFDQVWITPDFRAIDVRAEKTHRSDHRMVVCDLFLRESRGD